MPHMLLCVLNFFAIFPFPAPTARPVLHMKLTCPLIDIFFMIFWYFKIHEKSFFHIPPAQRSTHSRLCSRILQNTYFMINFPRIFKFQNPMPVCRWWDPALQHSPHCGGSLKALYLFCLAIFINISITSFLKTDKFC